MFCAAIVVFPAHAGMNRDMAGRPFTDVSGRVESVPRTRGDEPST